MKNFQLFFVLLTTLTLGVGNAWGAEETYTLGWGSATDTNSTNFTTTSGEVANVVSFTTAKNNSGSNPAYNSSNKELRLYYNAQGDGGSITLTPANGVTITGFVMTTSTTPDVKYSVNDGTAIAVSQSNKVYTVTGISASQSLKIQNVNTSNTQLRIKTIKITYEISTTSGEGGAEEPTPDPEDPTPGTGSSTGWAETAIGNITSSDIVVVTMTNSSGTFAMSNDKGTGSAPAAVKVTVNGDKLSEEPDDNLKWNISYSSGSLTIYPNGSTSTWLYCTNTNNGTRVGTNTSKTFTIDGTYLKHTETSRYVGVYNSQDWRCYTSSSTNIANQTLKFYKHIEQSSEGGGSGEPVPSLTANPTSLNFGTKNIYLESEKQGSLEIEITGQNLIGNVTAALSGTDATIFDLSQESFTPNSGEVSEKLTVSYEVTEEKEYSATLTLSSNGVEAIELPITLTTVNKKPTIYTKVTDAATLSAGDRVIFVYETGKVAAGKISNTTGGYLNAIDITQALDTTANPATASITDEAVIEYTLGGKTGAWELISTADKLSEKTANTGSSVDLKANGDTKWTISVTEGNATIKGSDNTIKYNTSSPRFKTYYSGQTAIQLYAISVPKYAVTFTQPEGGELIVKNGETAITSGNTFAEGIILTVTTTPAEGYEEGKVVIKNENGEDITTHVYADGTLTMPAHPITISATFERKPCSLLSTPTISATTTYNTATLTWNAVTNAEKYSVQIGTADAVETTETSYEVTGLNAETTYTYQVQAIAEAGQDTYCDSELAEGSFTTSQAPIATLILSENGETHDLDGEHRLYEIVTLPNTAATCTKTFVGWSADANCTTAPEYTPGASYTLSELTQTLYAVYATANGVKTKYIKLTTTPTPSFAGTYLIVNEEKQVAFNSGLTTLDTEGNTISVEITNDTIESNDAIENATFLIIKRQNENNYLIKSKSDKYIGRTTDANELDESTETEYTNTISIDADGNANIIGSGGAYLRYNATSGQERFRYYKSTSYTSQKAIALYKKYSIPLYTNYTTYCGDDITISSGTTQTFNTDQQINTLIIEGGATANLVAGNIEINTIILKGGLNADATDYKMPILYTNGATIDVDHLYLDLAINHNTYYPFAVPFPVSVSDIDYANPTLAAASEYGTHYLIKRYDGAERAKNGVNKDVNWVVVETDETLQPGVGYIISALTGKSETTTTIQIPLTFVPEQNSTLSIIAHTGNAAANDPIQKGWNFIAHPYLSKYAGNNINNAPRYVSIPTYNFSAYQQTMLMTTTLSPEYPFFVQIGKDTEINFTTEGRRQTPASVRADENNQILNLLFKILLADQAQDQTGIILDNNCTPAYEIDADLEKMFGSEFTTSIYTLCQDKRLAFNAMSFENAQSSPIPLGYRAAEAGEYTINLDIIEDASAYEHLYEGIVLYDSTTEIQTNLLYADYTFTTDKIQDDTRFSIQFVPKNNTSTNIENIENIHTTQKIIYNNQLYILHNGQIYNPIGQSIR